LGWAGPDPAARGTGPAGPGPSLEPESPGRSSLWQLRLPARLPRQVHGLSAAWKTVGPQASNFNSGDGIVEV
jgi:hypothetical protein